MEEVAQAQESGTSNRSVARALRHRRNADDLIFLCVAITDIFSLLSDVVQKLSTD